MNNNIMMYKSRLTYKEIEPVLQDLSAIKYSIIKGEALSVAAYNATGYLEYCDCGGGAGQHIAVDRTALFPDVCARMSLGNEKRCVNNKIRRIADKYGD